MQKRARDSRDVILSCLRNRFAMNAAMFQFLSPETATDYYDAVMSLAEMARREHPVRRFDYQGSILSSSSNPERSE